jgi:hypothetical protein
VTEKIKAKEQLEMIMEQNNKLIAEQQEKFAVSNKPGEVHHTRSADLSSFSKEQDEKKKQVCCSSY